MSVGNLGPDDGSPSHKQYVDTLVPPSPERFDHIAHIQAEKELETKRKAKAENRPLLSCEEYRQRGPILMGPDEATEAARTIQTNYRGYRTRGELDGIGLDAGERWISAIREALFRQSTKPHASKDAPEERRCPQTLDDPVDWRPSNARRNWKRAALVARRAGHDDETCDSSSGSSSEGKDASDRAGAKQARADAKAKLRQTARMMELQYFLEMVDGKHRYGNNLRMYHEAWKKSSTNESFFYWLDYGEGKCIELDTCPRGRLEEEQVRYLSREERQYYLVHIDVNGRLCWAKNGKRIDTTGEFKDSIRGIVPLSDPTPAFRPYRETLGKDESLHHTGPGPPSESASCAETNETVSEAADGYSDKPGLRKVTQISASVFFDKLLRKSVGKNGWIFVADTSFRLYVGIKDSGAFQHSSFLQGSRISAAGLIKVHDGRLTLLSPLSGHYRPPTSNFRAFIRSLGDAGADMSQLSISKSYPILIGLESYLKARRRSIDFVGKLMKKRRGKGDRKDDDSEEREQWRERGRLWPRYKATATEGGSGSQSIQDLERIWLGER